MSSLYSIILCYYDELDSSAIRTTNGRAVPLATRDKNHNQK